MKRVTFKKNIYVKVRRFKQKSTKGLLPKKKKKKRVQKGLRKINSQKLQKVWVHPAMLGERDHGNKGQTTHFRVNEPNPTWFDLHAFSFYLFIYKFNIFIL